MRITLDTRRDVHRLAKALCKASWNGDIPWEQHSPHDRKNWMREARRILDALAHPNATYPDVDDEGT